MMHECDILKGKNNVKSIEYNLNKKIKLLLCNEIYYYLVLHW